MPESSDLVAQAEQLKQRAENEPDAKIKAHLLTMAEHYAHLAQSQAWSREHPPSAAGLADVLIGNKE